MPVYLGIDGGKTRTTAIAADENGRILAKAEGGSIDYNRIPLAKARKNLKLILEVLAEKTEDQPCIAAAIGLTSLTGRAGKRDTAALCGGILTCDRLLIDRDIYIAMQCIRQPGARAVVISGVGSCAAVEDEYGERSCYGNWGALLGDEGSGYHIALDAVRYALRAEQGLEPPTKLVNEVYDYFEIGSFGELKALFDTQALDPKRISDFAGRVFHCAKHGDQAAAAIACAQAMQLADTVKTMLEPLPPDTFIGLWGGIFRYNRLYRNEFAARLLEQSGEYQIRMLDYPAECGALFAAYQLGGVTITDEILKNTDVYRGVRV